MHTLRPRQRRLPKRIRRRPGDSWTLWKVCGRHKVTRQEVATGYLVTSSDRSPEPIAYVAGISDRSLSLARQIRREPRKAAEAVDLRGDTLARFDRRLLGMLLLPINDLGRVIANDRTFAAATFQTMEIGGRRLLAFHVHTHYGLKVLKEESGTPARPLTSTPTSMEGEKAGELMAAVC
jgi:hypothetical protein